MPLTKSSQGQAFDRIWVDNMVRGITRVSWTHRFDFQDPAPYSYQLQVNRNQGELDDWEDIGTTAENVFVLLDDDTRLYGKQLRQVYRVVLDTIDGQYISENAQPFGALSKRQFLQARAIIRRALLDPRQMSAFDGYLLKRKIHAASCPDCVDPYTKQITNTDCDTCKGTGKVAGFWRAVENTMFDRAPQGDRTHRDPNHVRGTVDDVQVVGDFIGIPQIATKDVWVDASSDRRYYIDAVQAAAEIHGVPILVKAKLKLAELSDIIYTVDLDAGS